MLAVASDAEPDQLRMPLHVEAPAGTPRGPVVVLHEAFGLNAYIDRVLCDLAGLGYLACAPNLYHRLGGGTAAYDRFEEEARPLVSRSSDLKFAADFDAVLAHLREQGWDRSSVAVLGFSLGGRLAFRAATWFRLAAAVSFYPPAIVTAVAPRRYPSLLSECGRLETPWLGLVGEADAMVPATDVDRLAAALDDAPAGHRLVRYPGLGHGFHCPEQATYDAHGAAGAWGEAVAWLDRHSGAGPRAGEPGGSDGGSGPGA